MSAQPQFSIHCSQGERLGRLIEEMQYSCVWLVFVILLWRVVWCFVAAMSVEGLSKVVDNINVREIFFLLRNLIPVTQLYVSVDASTKESLKKIDRPLFRDFWPRFLDSLKALSEKVCRGFHLRFLLCFKML